MSEPLVEKYVYTVREYTRHTGEYIEVEKFWISVTPVTKEEYDACEDHS